MARDKAPEDGVDAFVDEVVPILQERGLFHCEYEGATLRDHLGARLSTGSIREFQAESAFNTFL